MKIFKLINIYVQVIFYFLAGLNHFLSPAVYVSMIPPFLPFPAALNYLSGAAEMIAAVLFALPKTRWIGAWGIVWLLVGVFPANIYMAMNGAPPEFPIPAEPWILWARLPIQFLLMYWAFAFRYEGAPKANSDADR